MDYYQRYIETSLECDRLRAKIEELEADRDRAWTHYAECAGTPLMADVMGERDTLRAKVAELEAELERAEHTAYINELVERERERIATKMLNPRNQFDWDLDPQALREWLANP